VCGLLATERERRGNPSPHLGEIGEHPLASDAERLELMPNAAGAAGRRTKVTAGKRLWPLPNAALKGLLRH
jgi:hypothetical protein